MGSGAKGGLCAANATVRAAQRLHGRSARLGAGVLSSQGGAQSQCAVQSCDGERRRRVEGEGVSCRAYAGTAVVTARAGGLGRRGRTHWGRARAGGVRERLHTDSLTASEGCAGETGKAGPQRAQAKRESELGDRQMTAATAPAMERGSGLSGGGSEAIRREGSRHGGERAWC